MKRLKAHLTAISTYSTLIVAILTAMWFVHNLDQRVTVLENVVQLNKSTDDASINDVQKTMDDMGKQMHSDFNNLNDKMDKNFSQLYLLFSQQVLARK